jgi:hypothetical protein
MRITDLVIWCCFILCTSCVQTGEDVIEPIQLLTEVDNLIHELGDSPQIFKTSGKEIEEVKGVNGTKIIVDPSCLVKSDGSKVTGEVEVQLIEMMNPRAMIFQNAATVSNGSLLETGGAYYINMTSDGVNLQIAEGREILVELPKLDDSEMSLFIGVNDSISGVNWEPVSVQFSEKILENPEQPSEPQATVREVLADSISSEMADLMAFLGQKPKKMVKEEVSPEVYAKYLEEMRAYEERIKEYEEEQRTYEAIGITKFGYINCDKFLYDESLKINIELIVNNDSIHGARFYALFEDINSMMTTYYYVKQEHLSSFQNVPTGKRIKILGLAATNGKRYMYQQDYETSKSESITVAFEEKSMEEIETAMNLIN